MAKSRSSRQTKKVRFPSPLTVRLDKESKACLADAAALRRISVSDYVRQVTVAQARKEVEAALHLTIALTADEQLAFWNALNAPADLTDAQRRLGSIIRGEERTASVFPTASASSACARPVH
jgi:uncharacterized protein (DUF1778 family)